MAGPGPDGLVGVLSHATDPIAVSVRATHALTAVEFLLTVISMLT